MVNNILISKIVSLNLYIIKIHLHVSLVSKIVCNIILRIKKFLLRKFHILCDVHTRIFSFICEYNLVNDRAPSKRNRARPFLSSVYLYPRLLKKLGPVSFPHSQDCSSSKPKCTHPFDSLPSPLSLLVFILISRGWDHIPSKSVRLFLFFSRLVENYSFRLGVSTPSRVQFFLFPIVVSAIHFVISCRSETSSAFARALFRELHRNWRCHVSNA